jgi:hypothetical protein
MKISETENSRKSLAGYGIWLVLRNLPEWAGSDFKTGAFNRSAIRVASPPSDAPDRASNQPKSNRLTDFILVIVHTLAAHNLLVRSTTGPIIGSIGVGVN